MELQEIFDNVNVNTDYTIYCDAGQYGIVPQGDAIPEGAVVEYSDVSGGTILKDAKKEFKDIWGQMTQSEQNAQKQEQEMTQQYYEYLTGGSNANTAGCKA